MILLAIDTSANVCAACLYDVVAGRILSERSDDIGRGHAEHLMALIADVVAQAGIGFDEIGKIGVTVGPGSFTGIRVGVATARGFAVARNVPVVGVTTLASIAAQMTESGPLDGAFAVTLKGGRGMVFAQSFAPDGTPSGEPFQIAIDAAGEHLAGIACLIGNASAELAAGTGARHAMPGAVGSIATIARLAAVSDAPPVPLYLRDADAKPQAGFALPRAAAELSK